MTITDPDTLEDEIRTRWDEGDMKGAATSALRGYGPEVFGYLTAIIRNEADTGDVYATFCEAMWRGLPDFRWQCSFRTWAYVLARHALSNRSRDPHQRARRAVPLSQVPEVYEIADDVRMRTLRYLRTEVKDRVAQLRERLDPEDESLIILRINRRLSWNEIARIIWEGDTEPNERQLRRKSATARKQFQRAKEHLRRLVEEEFAEDESNGSFL